MKSTSFEMETVKQSSRLCTRQKILTFGLILIISGLILGGASLGIGLYLMGESLPSKVNHTEVLPPTDATTVANSDTTTKEVSTIQQEVSSTAINKPSTSTSKPSSPTSSTETIQFTTTTTTASTTTISPETSTSTTISTEITEITTLYSKPECSETQFSCRSRQCINSNLRCNGKQDCLDKTDEHNCTDCSGFVCNDGLCLASRFTKCNGVFDCSDLSDEMNCLRPGYKLCNNTVSIIPDRWCDGVDDCGDNSDESNCRCVGGRFECPDKKCIIREWICDGHVDCLNGTDEANCNKCSENQFLCSDYSCIDLSLECDGKSDCPDGKDEKSCILVGETTDIKELGIKIKGEVKNICSDNWRPSLGTDLCRQQGYDEVSKVDFIKSSHSEPKSKWLVVPDTEYNSSNSKQSFIDYFNQSKACISMKSVYLACQQSACGERQVSFLQQFIAGGQLVPSGKWPWVVSVSYLDKPTCGGALISSEWVVTAGHCVQSFGSHDYTSTPYDVKVLLGSTDRKKGMTIRVQKIKPHPGLQRTTSGVVMNDIALLRLEHPVLFTDYIQPICLNTKEIFSRASFCYLAGWGLISWRQYEAVDLLREVKMLLWDDKKCSRNTVTGESQIDTNSTICTGYFLGLPTGCQGDSGGPLMCLNSRGHWSLAGVMSSGSNHCGRLDPGIRANRFMKISKYRSWINDIIHNV